MYGQILPHSVRLAQLLSGAVQFERRREDRSSVQPPDSNEIAVLKDRREHERNQWPGTAGRFGRRVGSVSLGLKQTNARSKTNRAVEPERFVDLAVPAPRLGLADCD